MISDRDSSVTDGGAISRLFGSPSLSGSTLEGLANQAFRDPNPINRRLAFSRLLESLTPANALEIRSRLVALGADGAEWRDFNFSRGAMAGKDTFDIASTTEERDLAATLGGWAAANSTEALGMLDTLGGGPCRQGLRHGCHRRGCWCMGGAEPGGRRRLA